jgi:hypothetical protein
MLSLRSPYRFIRQFDGLDNLSFLMSNILIEISRVLTFTVRNLLGSDLSGQVVAVCLRTILTSRVLLLYNLLLTFVCVSDF